MKKILIISGASLMLVSGLPSSKAAPAKNYNLTITAMQDSALNTDVTLKVAVTKPELTPPAEAKHIQLKSIDNEGTLRWTQNTTDVPLAAGIDGASATMRYTDMERQQRVQAHVQVQTPESTRTEVLRSSAIVQLRPDLEVGSINAESKVRPGTTLSVGAVIKELNGDLGASGTVYLKKGETVLDKIDIDVLPFGNVGVVFSTRLLEVGEHQLTISVPETTPGDFNSENNSQTFMVEVVTDIEPTYYYLSYQNRNQDFFYQWSSPYGSGYNAQKGKYQSLTMYIHPNSLEFPIENISFQATVDGGDGLTFESGPLPTSTTFYENGNDRFDYQFAHKYLGDNKWLGAWARTYSYAGVPQNTWSFAYYNQWAGDYVYYSARWDAAHGLIYQNTGTVLQGTFLAATDRIDARLLVKDSSGKTFGGGGSVQLYPTSWDYPINWTNGTYSESGYHKGTAINGWGYGITIP